MAKLFFTTLIACALGLFAIQAQTPFMGTVKYAVNMSNVDPLESPLAIHVIYGKGFIKIRPEFADTPVVRDAFSAEVLFDYAANVVYGIYHEEKKQVKMTTLLLPSAPVFIPQPDKRARMAGYSASEYVCNLNDSTKFNVWLADSLPLPVPDSIQNIGNLFPFVFDNLMLKIEGANKYRNDTMKFSLVAVDITPFTLSNMPAKVPEGYTLVDVDVDMKRLQDSLLREFKRVDSTFQVSIDSISGLPAPAPPPPPPPPPVKKPAPIKKKNSKPNTTKGRKSVS